MGCCHKIRNVVVGWSNLAKRTTNTQVKNRLRICRNCESNRWKGLRNWCKECHCYIPAKVRVPEETCKLFKW